MKRRRSGLTASLIKERVFLYGGEDDINPELAGPEIYDLETRVCQMVEIESYVSLKYHSAIAIGDCALEGYLNSCCIITVVCMTVALVSFLLGSVIYIGWWREDLWKSQLTKYNQRIYQKVARA